MTRLLLIVVLTGVLFLPGCWDRKEIDHIAFVLTYGVDQEKPGDFFHFTHLIGKPGMQGAGENGNGSDEAYYIVTNKSKASSMAMAGIMDFTPREMNLHHTSNVVLGEQLARNGVEEILDRGMRCRQCRPTINVFVATGSARELLQLSKSNLNLNPSRALVGLMEDTEGPFTAFPVQLIDFVKTFLAEGLDPVAPLVGLKGDVNKIANDEGENDENQSENPSDEQEIKINGLAVFRDDKLVGLLHGEEARGILWGMGKKKGRFVIDYPSPGKTTISNISNKSRAKVEINDLNMPVLILEVEAKGILSDWSRLTERIDIKPHLADTIRQAMKEKIEKEIKQVALVVQKELKADVFGFGQVLSRNHPEIWKEIKDDWNELYSILDLKIIVKTEIVGTGFIR